MNSPPVSYLPEVSANKAEIDGFDLIEDSLLRPAPQTARKTALAQRDSLRPAPQEVIARAEIDVDEPRHTELLGEYLARTGASETAAHECRFYHAPAG